MDFDWGYAVHGLFMHPFGLRNRDKLGIVNFDGFRFNNAKWPHNPRRIIFFCLALACSRGIVRTLAGSLNSIKPNPRKITKEKVRGFGFQWDAMRVPPNWAVT